jgi:hypothetical protein
MIYAAQTLNPNCCEPETRTAAVLVIRRSEPGALNFSNSSLYPLNAHIPSDPLIDGMTYRCLSGGAAKLANDREQLDVADLWRRRRCVRQSHPLYGMRSASLGGNSLA